MGERMNDVKAARYLGGRSPQTLRNWRSTGQGPCYIKQGRMVVYDTEDLDLYLKEHRIDPTKRGRA